YAFELKGITNSTPIVWNRTTSNPYSGGAAYRNRGLLLSSGATRDSALAIYTNVPPPPAPTLCTVNWTDVRQRIDGFGAGVQFLDPRLPSPVSHSTISRLLVL